MTYLELLTKLPKAYRDMVADNVEEGMDLVKAIELALDLMRSIDPDEYESLMGKINAEEGDRA